MHLIKIDATQALASYCEPGFTVVITEASVISQSPMVAATDQIILLQLEDTIKGEELMGGANGLSRKVREGIPE